MNRKFSKVSSGNLRGTFGFKQFWPVYLIGVLLAGADFLDRFAGLVNLELLAPTLSSGDQMSEVTILTSEVHASYLEKLAGYTKEPASEPAGELASKDEQAAGRDYRLFRGTENEYKLMAILGASEKFAVVKRLDDGLAADKLFELRLGDTFEKFSVSEIRRFALVLRDEKNERVEINLFSPAQFEEGR